MTTPPADLTAEECFEYMQLIKGEQDWLEKHGAWALTVVGLAAGCIGGVLTYFLRSRCKKLKFGCTECKGDNVAFGTKESIANYYKIKNIDEQK